MVDLNLYDLLVYKKMNNGGGGDIDVESLSVTENGSYNAGEGKAYNPVIVNVQPDLITKSITQNGTYTASSDNADGYSSVDVHVSGYKITDVSGLPSAIATFSDASALPMPKLEIGIEPVQDLHGYDSPWVGGAGKNKFDKTTVNEDVYINANGTLTSSQYNQDVTDYIPVISGQSYIINDSLTSSNYSCFYDENKDKIGNVFANNLFPQTAPSGAKYLRVTFSKASVNTFMVEQGTTASSTYYPYFNICPISGWDEVNVNVCGVNVWDEEWESGDYNPNTGEKRSDSARFRSKNPIMCLANTNYYFKHPSNADNAYIIFFDANNNFISSKYCAKGGTGTSSPIFTTPINARSFGFFVWASSAVTYNNDISINYPSTDTSYHAYNGHTYTIPFYDSQGNPIEVYGGTVDLVSGQLVVDRAMVDLGSCAWDVRSESVIRCTVSAEANFESQYKAVNGICSAYIIVSQNSLGDGKLSFNNSTQIYLQDNNHTFSTQSDAQQYLNGQKLVYELATPLTIQLTPTAVKSLQGLNNVFADTGDVVEASYFESL